MGDWGVHFEPAEENRGPENDSGDRGSTHGIALASAGSGNEEFPVASIQASMTCSCLSDIHLMNWEIRARFGTFETRHEAGVSGVCGSLIV
jgi:hypothetical protein